MHDLAAFQRAFGRALLDGHPSPDARSEALNLALTIHRNTSMKGLVDALAANYPTVAQLVGEEWFRACAVEYVRAHPAGSPVLATYGEAFPSFLLKLPQAAELPYLPDVARLDRLWVESHTAADARTLTPGDLRALPEAGLATQRLALHPAVRIAWVEHSAATIWIHHRSLSTGVPLNVDDVEEGLLLTRPLGKVEHQPLDRAMFGFLEALSRGAPLAQAAEAALTIDPEADIARTFAQTLAAGSFQSMLEVPS
jgi:hypothetical protein